MRPVVTFAFSLILVRRSLIARGVGRLSVGPARNLLGTSCKSEDGTYARRLRLWRSQGSDLESPKSSEEAVKECAYQF